MTPAYLSAIRARLDAATPGPWRHDETHGAGYIVASRGVDAEEPLIAEVAAGEPIDSANAAFIENAPTDIAALLAEVERLRREVPPEMTRVVAAAVDLVVTCARCGGTKQEYDDGWIPCRRCTPVQVVNEITFYGERFDEEHDDEQ